MESVRTHEELEWKKGNEEKEKYLKRVRDGKEEG